MARFRRPVLAALSIGVILGAAACMETFDVPEAETADGKAFLRRCSLCHALPDPTRMHYAQWQKVVERMAMNVRAQNVPPMSDAEQEQILNYLERNAKPLP
jgi:cytochrome c2